MVWPFPAVTTNVLSVAIALLIGTVELFLVLAGLIYLSVLHALAALVRIIGIRHRCSVSGRWAFRFDLEIFVARKAL